MRIWNAYDKVQQFNDGFELFQTIAASVEGGVDGDELEAAFGAIGDFVAERAKQRIINGGLKAVGTIGGKVIGAAGSGLQSIGKGRLKFGRFEVRAVRDLSHVDESTLRQMKKDGFAATTKNGDKIDLHHLDQNPNGPLVEIPRPNHKISNRTQHPNGNTPGGGLTEAQREVHDAWRESYWKARAAEEMMRRGINPDL